MKVKDLTLIAMFAGLIAICSWISIPLPVPFTMQTFGVFAALLLLGGKRGTASVLVYLCLGIIGLPVFSGFNSGLGAIMGPTGGYLAGFAAICLVYWLGLAFFGEKPRVMVISLILGLCLCYLFGSVWFMVVFAQTQGAITFWAVMLKCVIPFIIPDLLKLALAMVIWKRLSPLGFFSPKAAEAKSQP